MIGVELHPPPVRPCDRRGRFRLLALLFAVTSAAASSGHTQTLSVDYFGTGTNRFGIEFVEIGDPGNPQDGLVRFMTQRPEGVGAVGYVYRMAKHETSKGSVKEVNGIGELFITHNNQESTYPPWSDRKPATNMTFYEIARFINWLNLVVGYPPAYRFSESGDWQLWDMEDSWRLDRLNRYRHGGALYFLASVDEWHKAAYWDQMARRYWLYPTGSDNPPLPVPEGTNEGTAVYMQPVDQGPADVDSAGGLSPYGVMGMGGNLWEFLETAQHVPNDAVTELLLIRGGRWYQGPDRLAATGTDQGRPWDGNNDSTTFRIAALPPLMGDSDGDGVGDRGGEDSRDRSTECGRPGAHDCAGIGGGH
ncbi:MAG: SUMF1/EgtB/PvdO family nonheme iron enzyme [Verrucomicrobia bacterium]|nr:SUMF1/EgtB/PvdO family nonheme iron enzyme [Verrucomicrobiota bacterium]